ncbi:MAG: hypothetical protein WBM75_18690 [Polyangiales bacterium]|jgi:hypothetical protein
MFTLKKALTVITLTASLFVLSPAAHAQASSGFWSRFQSWWDQVVAHYHAKQGDEGGRAVPELDPGAAGSALLLVVGGVAYIASRRREDEEVA